MIPVLNVGNAHKKVAIPLGTLTSNKNPATIFGPETHPLLEEIQAMDVDSISPLEALNKLYELKQRANE